MGGAREESRVQSGIAAHVLRGLTPSTRTVLQEPVRRNPLGVVARIAAPGRSEFASAGLIHKGHRPGVGFRQCGAFLSCLQDSARPTASDIRSARTPGCRLETIMSRLDNHRGLTVRRGDAQYKASRIRHAIKHPVQLGIPAWRNERGQLGVTDGG